MKKLKLVTFGGGSSYTPELVDGLIRMYDELPITEYYLVDIEAGREKMEINRKLVQRMLERENIPIQVKTTLDVKEALEDADFVTTQIRVGGMELRVKDEVMSFAHDVLGQETNGPAGFASALRTIPVLLDIAYQMEELCPEAWLINFTNPAGIVTEAISKHSTIRSIGICSGANNMRKDIAALYGEDYRNVEVDIFGLNHLMFARKIAVNHVDKTEEVLRQLRGEAIDGLPVKTPDYDPKFMKALHLYPLSGYLHYTYLEEEVVPRYKADSLKNGTRGEQIVPIEKELFDLYQNEDLVEKPKQLSMRGGSLYSDTAIAIISAIYNDKNERHVANVQNKGATVDLEYESAIECTCLVNRNGAIPLTIGKLPLSVRGIIQQTNTYEALCVEAAVTGDYDTAVLAMANNPYVHSVNKAVVILDELLENSKAFLPQFYK